MKQYRLFFLVLTLQNCTYPKLDQEKVENYNTWFRTFNEIINIFETRYYKEVDPQGAMVQAIKGYALQDPHTTFLDKKSCKELQEQLTGEFFGIGVNLPGDKKKDEDFFPVIETVPGGPADKAGVKAGDKVVQINDEAVRGLDIDEVMTRLKGEKNTKVTLKVLRAQYPEPLTIDIIRDVVKDEMDALFYLPHHKVYYLLLYTFTEKSPENVEKVIIKALEEKSKGVVLDLRNNTGGLFDGAIDIAGLFLPRGTPVVSIKARDGKVTSQWKTTRTPLVIPHSLPILILVNNYTASASEILAGVLQIYAEKKNLLSLFIVGDVTFGKGSVQDVIPVSNEGAIKLTTGLYYLPYNTSIQGKGITPDFVLENRQPPSETMKWLTSTYGKEKSLKGTINPHEKDEPDKKEADDEKIEKSWRQKREELLAQDYLIQNSVNLIELFHLGKKLLPQDFTSHAKALKFMKEHYVIDTNLKLQEIALTQPSL